MSRRTEYGVTLSLGSIITVPVLIGGVTYYRHALFQFGSTIPMGGWGQLVWHPGASHIPLDALGAQAATIGAGVELCPVKLGIWLVPVGGVDVTPGAVTPAERAPIVLSPGQAVDLGGWDGDLLLCEGARGGFPGPEPYSFTSIPFQARVGPCLTFVFDTAVRFTPIVPE